MRLSRFVHFCPVAVTVVLWIFVCQITLGVHIAKLKRDNIEVDRRR